MYLIHMRGAKIRMEREQNQSAWLAWHAAYLPQMKKPVQLQELMIGYVPKPVDWESQLAAWKSYSNYKAH